jgi:hypothetical protein
MDIKYLRAQTAAYMLPAMAAEVVAILRDASPKQVEDCRLPKDFNLASFVTGANFMFSPLSQQVIAACCRLVSTLRPNSLQVWSYDHYSVSLTCPSSSNNSPSKQIALLCFQALRFFQFAQAFSAAQADSLHRIVEGNVAMLQGEDAQDGITASIIREKWNRGLGHFTAVCFPKGDDFSLAT